MSVEESFLNDIESRPNDNDRRLVYADWLETQGDKRSEFVRLEILLYASETVQKRNFNRLRLNQCGEEFDSMWKVRIERLTIENCPTSENTIEQYGQHGKFEFNSPCELNWAELEVTEDPKIRNCTSCKQRVFFCENMSEALKHRGSCIAVRSDHTRRAGDLSPRSGSGKRNVVLGPWWGRE